MGGFPMVVIVHYINIEYISMADQVANALTKGLPLAKLE